MRGKRGEVSALLQKKSNSEASLLASRSVKLAEHSEGARRVVEERKNQGGRRVPLVN